ncbi:hypothetical protein IscW_ISCW022570 [Ixodes scapularis]|uniref:Uncharacterized protein n=1 Tax=Ixodes scapularis TaxID=6945 RepID=B7QFC2_IXOSC|nr:hypothetical protein IscW_ISCW022570 [Ixodes scapularis]|eukprot:XP_002414236.1 hypothetical protein IscW_ISCW022570 [Ixodes scapularis]
MLCGDPFFRARSVQDVFRSLCPQGQVTILVAGARDGASVPIVTPSKDRTRFANISIHGHHSPRKPLPSVHKLNASCLHDNSFCESLPGYPE